MKKKKNLCLRIYKNAKNIYIHIYIYIYIERERERERERENFPIIQKMSYRLNEKKMLTSMT